MKLEKRGVLKSLNKKNMLLLSVIIDIITKNPHSKPDSVPVPSLRSREGKKEIVQGSFRLWRDWNKSACTGKPTTTNMLILPKLSISLTDTQ